MRAALDALIAADNAGDLDAIASAYCADAVLLPPGGGVVQGRDAIRERYSEGFEQFRLKVRIHTEDIRVGDDWAVCRGRTEGRYAWYDGRQPTPFEDRYMMMLEKRPGEGWRVLALIWNPEPKEER